MTPTNDVLNEVIALLQAELPPLLEAETLSSPSLDNFQKCLVERLDLIQDYPAVRVGASDAPLENVGVGGLGGGVNADFLDIIIFYFHQSADYAELVENSYIIKDCIILAMEQDLDLNDKISMFLGADSEYDADAPDDSEKAWFEGIVAVRWRVQKNRVIGSKTI